METAGRMSEPTANGGAAVQNGESPASELVQSGQTRSLSAKTVSRCSPKELVDAARRRERRSHEKLAAHIGIGKDSLYAITGETRWVSDETYTLVAEVCKYSPEDLRPRDLPPPKRRRQ
jgi:phage portal protein BeeE